MPISTAAILQNSTTFAAPTGGTSIDLSIASNLLGGKALAYFDGDANFITRRTIDFQVKDPVASAAAPGGYTQARETVLLKVPMTLANGKRTVNTLRIELSRDPELTEAAAKEMRFIGLQILGDSDFWRFWDYHEIS